MGASSNININNINNNNNNNKNNNNYNNNTASITADTHANSVSHAPDVNTCK